jgi:hypothetical protein
MVKVLALPVAALVLAALPEDGVAAKLSINFPAATITPNGMATNADGTALAMASTGESGGFITFTLPRDYKAGTVLELRLLMYSNTASACSVFMFPRQAIRQRPGNPVYNNTERFTVVGGPLANSPAQFTTMTKSFELRGPLAATFSGQKPGDGITLEFGRDGDQGTDTCGNLFVTHAEIRYTRK